MATDGVETAEDPTLGIPDELLGLILEHLDPTNRATASLVCRRWLRLEATTHHVLSLRSGEKPPLRRLLLRFSGITRLGLRCERSRSGVDSGAAAVDDSALLEVASLCPQLQKLKLKNCAAITDDGLVAFAAALAGGGRLRSFSCSGCGFGARGLNAVLHECAGLEQLSVKRLRFNNELLLPPPATSSPLWRLSVKQVDGGHVVAPLMVGCPRLRSVAVSRVAGNWDKLLELVVAGRSGSKPLSELVDLRLERLHLTDKGLRAVADRCRRLESLLLSRLPGIGDAGLTAVVAASKCLRRLHIDCCPAIGDAGLAATAAASPALTELVLVSARAEGGGVAPLLAAGGGGSLQRLAVWNSDGFSDTELRSVVLSCPSLRKLCVRCCPISDVGVVEALAASGACPNLCRLKIKRCRKVSESTAGALQASRPTLLVSIEPPEQRPPRIAVPPPPQEEERPPAPPTRSPLARWIAAAFGRRLS